MLATLEIQAEDASSPSEKKELSNWSDKAAKIGVEIIPANLSTHSVRRASELSNKEEKTNGHIIGKINEIGAVKVSASYGVDHGQFKPVVRGPDGSKAAGDGKSAPLAVNAKRVKQPSDSANISIRVEVNSQPPQSSSQRNHSPKCQDTTPSGSSALITRVLSSETPAQVEKLNIASGEVSIFRALQPEIAKCDLHQVQKPSSPNLAGKFVSGNVSSSVVCPFVKASPAQQAFWEGALYKRQSVDRSRDICHDNLGNVGIRGPSRAGHEAAGPHSGEIETHSSVKGDLHVKARFDSGDIVDICKKSEDAIMASLPGKSAKPLREAPPSGSEITASQLASDLQRNGGQGRPSELASRDPSASLSGSKASVLLVDKTLKQPLAKAGVITPPSHDQNPDQASPSNRQPVKVSIVIRAFSPLTFKERSLTFLPFYLCFSTGRIEKAEALSSGPAFWAW